LIPGVAKIQVQDLALGLVEPHEVHTGPPLRVVKVPLDSIPSLMCADCTAQLGVLGKLLGVYLIPLSMSPTKMLKSAGPNTEL